MSSSSSKRPRGLVNLESIIFIYVYCLSLERGLFPFTLQGHIACHLMHTVYLEQLNGTMWITSMISLMSDRTCSEWKGVISLSNPFLINRGKAFFRGAAAGMMASAAKAWVTLIPQVETLAPHRTLKPMLQMEMLYIWCSIYLNNMLSERLDLFNKCKTCRSGWS